MTAEFIYVGIRKSDGSLRAMCCDDPGAEEHTAECVADWIKRGLMVVRMSDEEYRKRVRQETRPVDPLPDELMKKSDCLDYIADQFGKDDVDAAVERLAKLTPPPLPTQDLSKSDQTPGAIIPVPEGMSIREFAKWLDVEADPDNTKTRLVRTPVDHLSD